MAKETLADRSVEDDVDGPETPQTRESLRIDRVIVRPRLGRLSPRPTLAVLVVLLVALAGAAGVLLKKNDHTQNIASAEKAALATSKESLVTLLSYDYRELDGLADQTSNLVTGDFADRYRALLNEELIPAAKQKKVVTRTEIATASVVDGSTTKVDLLVFVNQVSATAGSETPILSGSRVRVQMRLVDGSWRVSAIDPV